MLCVSGCTGGANGGFFGKEDVAVLLLTSVAAILLRCASRGGSVQSSAHTSLPCSVEVCVCVCALLLQSPPLFTCVLQRESPSVFTAGFVLFELRLCSY